MIEELKKDIESPFENIEGIKDPEEQEILEVEREMTDTEREGEQLFKDAAEVLSDIEKSEELTSEQKEEYKDRVRESLRGVSEIIGGIGKGVLKPFRDKIESFKNTIGVFRTNRFLKKMEEETGVKFAKEYDFSKKFFNKTAAKFPLDETGRKIIESRKVYNWSRDKVDNYQTIKINEEGYKHDVVRQANIMYSLLQEGLPFDFLEKIDFSESISDFNVIPWRSYLEDEELSIDVTDPDFIESLRVLNNMKTSLLEDKDTHNYQEDPGARISLRGFDKITSENLRLSTNNEFGIEIPISRSSDIDNLSSLNLEVLGNINKHFPEIKSLVPLYFDALIKSGFFDKSPEDQELIKKLITSKYDGEREFYNCGESIKFVNDLSEEEKRKVKLITEKTTFKPHELDDVKEIMQHNDSDIIFLNRLSYLYMSIETLKKIEEANLTEEQKEIAVSLSKKCKNEYGQMETDNLMRYSKVISSSFETQKECLLYVKIFLDDNTQINRHELLELEHYSGIKVRRTNLIEIYKREGNEDLIEIMSLLGSRKTDIEVVERFLDDPQRYIDTGLKDVTLSNIEVGEFIENIDKINELLSHRGCEIPQEMIDIYRSFLELNEILAKDPTSTKSLHSDNLRSLLNFGIEGFIEEEKENSPYLMLGLFRNIDAVNEVLDKNDFEITPDDKNSYLKSMVYSYLEQGVSDSIKDFLELIDEEYLSEQDKQYIEIFQEAQTSQSPEIRVMAAEITNSIIVASSEDSTDNHKELFKKIEDIFIKNNIPLVGKQYKIFELLYPNKVLQDRLGASKVESLRKLNNSGQVRLEIFKDLMRIHIFSADPDLEEYMRTLRDNSVVLRRFESGEELTESESLELKSFLYKINSISGHVRGIKSEVTKDINQETMQNDIDDLRSAFAVKEGQAIIERFEEVFLKRIGISSIDEALEKMDKYKQGAHERNVALASSGKIEINKGDITKGIQSQFFKKNLETGVYSPEFVGASSVQAKSKSKGSGDYTPFDTDLLRMERDTSFEDAYSDYGDINLIIKDKDSLKEEELDRFDVDNSRFTNGVHHCIRTGFGTTQIDAIGLMNTRDRRVVEDLRLAIAKKGFYIPICDREGNVTFTIDDYNQERKVFRGIDSINKDPIEIDSSWKTEAMASEINNSKQGEKQEELIDKTKRTVISTINEILEEHGIKLRRDSIDQSIEGASLSDTGSTGRGTSLDTNFDFDFALKLDYEDHTPEKIKLIQDSLAKFFEQNDSYTDVNVQQFRSKEIEIEGVKFSVDVGIVRKDDIDELNTHEALQQKFESIKSNSGIGVYNDVLANIRFAKKKLKEAECYKKGNQGQGGIGGIGVEYWILQHEGNVINAFRAFHKASHNNGEIIDIDEFKKSYDIISAGKNIKGQHGYDVEDFAFKLTESGYQKMAKLSEKFA